MDEWDQACLATAKSCQHTIIGWLGAKTHLKLTEPRMSHKLTPPNASLNALRGLQDYCPYPQTVVQITDSAVEAE